MEKSDRHQIRFFFILDFLCAYLRVHTINGVISDWFLVHVVLLTHLESSKIYSIICGVIIMVPGLHNETSKITPNNEIKVRTPNKICLKFLGLLYTSLPSTLYLKIIIPIISNQVVRLRTCNFMFWWGLPSLPTKDEENVVMDMEIVQNYGPS